MKDRISTRVLENGAIRYAEYDANGALVGYRYMLPADEPSEVGTPINKASLMTDDVAARFNMAQVPNDALAFLAKFNEHWWTRTPLDFSVVKTNITNLVEIMPPNSSGTSRTIYWSETVVVHDGVLELENPKSMTVQYADGNTIVAKSPCYVSNLSGSPTTIYYLPQGSTYSPLPSSEVPATISSWGGFYLSNGATVRAQTVTVQSGQAGSTELVHSTNRSAYPDSGVSGGYEYEYLGVPFEKFPTTPSLETGKYVGTGTYGENNKTVLELNKRPIIVAITGGGTPVLLVRGSNTHWFALTASSNKALITTWEDNTISWYNTETAGWQYNTAGAIYNYYAIVR